MILEADLTGSRFVDTAWYPYAILFDRAILLRAYFSGVHFTFDNTFRECHLSDADFHQAHIVVGQVEYCEMERTNVISAQTGSSKFFRCGMKYANVADASLQATDFSFSDLSFANFKTTRCYHPNARALFIQQ